MPLLQVRRAQDARQLAVAAVQLHAALRRTPLPANWELLPSQPAPQPPPVPPGLFGTPLTPAGVAAGSLRSPSLQTAPVAAVRPAAAALALAGTPASQPRKPGRPRKHPAPRGPETPAAAAAARGSSGGSAPASGAATPASSGGGDAKTTAAKQLSSTRRIPLSKESRTTSELPIIFT